MAKYFLNKDFSMVLRFQSELCQVIIIHNNDSGAPAAQRAAKRSPILIMQGKDKGNP